MKQTNKQNMPQQKKETIKEDENNNLQQNKTDKHCENRIDIKQVSCQTKKNKKKSQIDICGGNYEFIQIT